MAKVFGLDIPEELIALYNAVVKLFPYGENFTTTRIKAIISRANKARLENASLFIRWQPVWAEFLEARRIAWANYWQTLPFGSHSGIGGWPGSGYSAFVYVNAPRFKAGLELLLDPPGFDGGLVLNGDFAEDTEHWYFDEDFMPTENYFSVVDGVGQFLPYLYEGGDPRYLAQDLDFEATGTSYRLEFDAKIPLPFENYDTGFELRLGSGDNDAVMYSDGDWHHYTVDYPYSEEEEGWPFGPALRIWPIGIAFDADGEGGGTPYEIDNISVKVLEV